MAHIKEIASVYANFIFLNRFVTAKEEESNNKYVKVLLIWHALQGRMIPAAMRGENATFMHRSTHTSV